MADFTDVFNRAEGPVGANWVQGFGGFNITGEQDIQGATVEGLDFLYVNPATVTFAANQRSSIVYGTPVNFDRGGVVVRGSGTRGYGICTSQLMGASTRRIFRFADASTIAVLGTVDVMPGAGERAWLYAEGPIISAYIEAELVDAVEDATYASGQPGIIYGREGFGGLRLDNFFAEDIIAAIKRGKGLSLLGVG